MSELYNIFPVKEASGNPATFDDGADGIPMESLLAQVNPIQDLHGYASPWGPGGGANLCRVARTFTTTAQGITYSEDEFGTVHCTGTATAESVSAGAPNTANADSRCLYTLPAGTYTISNVGTVRVYVSFRNEANTDNLISSRNVQVGANYTFTVSAPVIVYIRADILTGETIDADVLCMVTAGSTVATVFEPFQNICSISGKTSLSAYGTGKNLLPKSTKTDGVYNGITTTFNADGSITLDGTTTGVFNINFPEYGILVDVPPGDYILSGGVLSYVYMTFYDGTDSTGTRYDNTSGDTPVTISTGHAYNMRLVITNGRTVSNLTVYPMLRPAGTDNTFAAPRRRDVHTVNWSTQAGTVFGCTVDLVTGLLTVDRYKFITTWSAGTNSTMYDNNTKERRRFSYHSAPADDKAKITDALCNVAKYIPNDTSTEWAKGSVFSLHASNQYLYLCLPANTDGSTEIELCYYLASPIEYQLTPQQIATLLGANNVWTDAGPVTIQYHSDAGINPKAIEGLVVDGVNLQDDAWFLKWRRLSAPAPKTDYVSVFGKDGDVDLTENETDGQVFFENRSLALDMKYIGEDWEMAYSDLLNLIHGKRCFVQFSNDPYWYWSGRIIASEFDHKSRSLAMSGIMFPYKLSVAKIIKTASVDGAVEGTAETVTLPGSRMRVSPLVTVTTESESDSVTLKWGNSTKALSAGTYYVRGLKVGANDVTIKVWGTGTVNFEYRKGML